MKLITPAMASEPYWAAAPSRSTSTLLMPMLGSCPMSEACAPLLMAAPNSWIRAERWRRLEFTSTRTSSGGRPRSEVERTKELPSPVSGVAV